MPIHAPIIIGTDNSSDTNTSQDSNHANMDAEAAIHASEEHESDDAHHQEHDNAHLDIPHDEDHHHHHHSNNNSNRHPSENGEEDNDDDEDADSRSLMDVRQDITDYEDNDEEEEDKKDDPTAHTEHGEDNLPVDQERNAGDDTEADVDDSFYASLEPLPPNKVFAVAAKFKDDDHPERINLTIGAFRDDDGRPVILKVVKAVESEIVNDINMEFINHEYPPMGGSQLLVRATARLAFGEDTQLIKEGRVAGIQALSGTGALCIASEFLRDHHDMIYIPNPTWENHRSIFKGSGMEVREYTYYDNANCSLDMAGLVEDLKSIPMGQAVLFHACAHNPTGVDPTKNQWKQIAAICQARHLQVVFDCAYLGFASGDMDTDAWAMRYFSKLGMEFFVCFSYSKNVGIYSERCGVVMYHAKSAKVASSVNSHMMVASRRIWSVPPQHGSRIVERILSHKARTEEWKKEVKNMADRILGLRQELYDELTRVVGGNWSHVIRQKGMFTYTGLNKSQCDALVKHHHVYLLDTGRISVAGIPKGAVPLLVSKIKLVVDAFVPEPEKIVLAIDSAEENKEMNAPNAAPLPVV